MRVRSLAALALGATLLAGCTVPRPSGDGPLRYRDQVFGNVTVTPNITYGSAPNAQGEPVDLKLDLYQPAGDTVAKRPALVWVHGGGFHQGSKSSGASKATFFAKLGYVAASIDYRLLAPAGCSQNPDQPICTTAALAAQHDAQAAVRWLRANAVTHRIDTSRIAMGGGSAGAVTSLLVGWRSEDPGTSGNPGHSSAIRAAVSVSGGIPTSEYIDRSDPPTLFFHGTEDPVVPFGWAINNAAAMYSLGIFTVFESIDGAGHGLSGSHAQLINEQSDYFLYYAMDLPGAQR
ncbi:MAG: para-nitrobenzyl esterase [Thermoleophilaceae bacterium]|jgi:acetyl esterase/lipase|nr:para-nitrobenzyl esterase [Thermoleophilaceae bacterium]